MVWAVTLAAGQHTMDMEAAMHPATAIGADTGLDTGLDTGMGLATGMERMGTRPL